MGICLSESWYEGMHSHSMNDYMYVCVCLSHAWYEGLQYARVCVHLNYGMKESRGCVCLSHGMKGYKGMCLSESQYEGLSYGVKDYMHGYVFIRVMV